MKCRSAVNVGFLVLLLLPTCCLMPVLNAGSNGGSSSQTNSVFAQLITLGVPTPTEGRLRLPPPAMRDGLTAEQQRYVIDRLEGRQADVDELLRRSPVTPFVLHFQEVPVGNEQSPGRLLQLAFVAFGRFEDLTQRDFLDAMLNSGRKDAHIVPLPPAAVQARRLQATAGEEERTGWAHVRLTLMDRVELRGTCRTVWSSSAESLLVAAQLEPACVGDAEYPNAWQLLHRDTDGSLRGVGSPEPYLSLGYYLKITRLSLAPDALFVEWHLGYLEPFAWFEGANLLRSKLPLVLQTKVRAFRRDLLRAFER